MTISAIANTTGRPMVKNIVVLGSTGSIGRSTLAVLRENRERFRLLGLAAGGNTQLLEKQIAEFEPQAVSVKSRKSMPGNCRSGFPGLKIFYGAEGLLEIVSLPQADCVVAAINGTDGLPATFQAIRLKRRLCLANKETLVAAGELINREASARRRRDHSHRQRAERHLPVPGPAAPRSTGCAASS